MTLDIEKLKQSAEHFKLNDCPILVNPLSLLELITRLEVAERDAERYRWLRDSDNQLHEDDPSVADSFFNVYFDFDLDEVIDRLIIRNAAMKEKP